MITYNDDNYIISCPSCGSGDLIRDGKNDTKNPKDRWKCKNCSYKTVSPVLGEPDIIKEGVKLAKQKQAHQDTNRIERKTFREYARLENSVTALNQSLLNVLRDNKEIQINIKPEPLPGLT